MFDHFIMHKLDSQMETKTLVFIVLLASGASAGAFNVVLTCQPCSSSCSYASCYKLTSDGYNEVLCLECTGSVNEKFVINNCANDYIGAVCSSGFCITLPSIQACYTSFETASLCQTSQTISTSCGPCILTPCSTNCYRTQSSIYGSTQSCMDCPNTTLTNMTIYACPNGKDPQGNTCPCCFSTNLPGGLDPQCTAQNPLFNSTGFRTYAKKRTATENTTNKPKTSRGALMHFYSFGLISIAVILMF